MEVEGPKVKLNKESNLGSPIKFVAFANAPQLFDRAEI